MVDRITEEVDLDDLPIDPTGGCVDPFLWRLARDKYEAHRRTPAGECVTCPGGSVARAHRWRGMACGQR